MSENKDDMDWTNEKKTIAVTVDYDDPQPTPPLEVTPDEDGLTKVADENAKQLASKTWLKDMRASMAQWILLCGYILSKLLGSVRAIQTDYQNYKDSVEKRTGEVEQRMTTQETTYKGLIKQLTDADKGDAAAEVIAARTSSMYGDFATLKARMDATDAKIASVIPGGFDVTITHGLGRNPAISVSYYEYAIGTETDGLGTGPYGLGGSEPINLQATVSYPDANSATVTLPVAYNLEGTPVQHADGNYYLTDGYKTLRFELQ